MTLKHIFAAMVAVLTTSGAFAVDDPVVNPNDYKTVTSVSYVTAEVNKKQDQISVTNRIGKAVTYPESPGGNPTARTIVADIDASGVTNDDLPTVGAVKAALTDKQDKIGDGTYNGQVVLYANGGAPTDHKAIYAGASYSTTSGNLARARDVNGAAANAFNSHMTCYACSSSSYASNPANCPAASCTLWTVNNNLSGVYVPNS